MAKSKKDLKIVPMFKTVEMMAKFSGVGENTLRTLMETRKLDFIQIGNKRLIADEALWAWYQRNKVAANIEAEV